VGCWNEWRVEMGGTMELGVLWNEWDGGMSGMVE